MKCHGHFQSTQLAAPKSLRLAAGADRSLPALTKVAPAAYGSLYYMFHNLKGFSSAHFVHPAQSPSQKLDPDPTVFFSKAFSFLA